MDLSLGIPTSINTDNKTNQPLIPQPGCIHSQFLQSVGKWKYRMDGGGSGSGGGWSWFHEIGLS